ncbi:MAG TPA: hypothetical protein VN802_11775 [Stellaceae bacterium]|nr:hypothetical protein [Stellaceae bacterium]
MSLYAGMVMLAGALLMLHGGPARADENQRKAGVAWKQADLCAHDSFKKFPDYTPESNAKRDAARRECLRNHKLPETGSAAAATQPSEPPQ